MRLNSIPRWQKVIGLLVLVLVTYLSVGYLLHLVIFPEKIPAITTYFQEGDVFESKFEGLRQTVLKQENGRVHCHLDFMPYAPGPPLHVHTRFDELFENGSKPLSLIVDSDTVTLKPYEKLRIPKGVPHKPFNNTGDSIAIGMKDFAFPEEFAFYLNQVYGYLDESPENMQPPGILLQMSMFNQYFDSYLPENGPIPVQKTIGFVIVPLARLLGYKSYYSKFDPKR